MKNITMKNKYYIQRLDTGEYLSYVESTMSNRKLFWSLNKKERFTCETYISAQYYAELYLPPTLEYKIVNK